LGTHTVDVTLSPLDIGIQPAEYQQLWYEEIVDIRFTRPATLVEHIVESVDNRLHIHVTVRGVGLLPAFVAAGTFAATYILWWGPTMA